MSARIVLTTFGSSGDVHPYIGLSLALKARGHDPVIATSEYYRGRIESAGVRFHPIRPEFDPTDPAVVARIMDPLRGGEYLIRDVVMRHLRESHEDLRALATGADLLVTHPLTFAGPVVAKELGVRWVSTVLAPMSFFSVHDFPVFAAAPQLHAARHLGIHATRPLIRMAKLAARSWGEPVRALRAELGLPPAPDPVFEGQHSPRMVLALFSRVLAEPQPDWPGSVRITGNIFFDGSDAGSPALDPELDHFLRSGSPPVVFTLGTSAVGAAGRFYEESASAAHAIGERAVLLIGHDARNRPLRVAESVMVREYAPYSLLFPRAAAVVHQGGVGTTAQALRAGKPTLIVPHAHDQPDNAFRVEALGVSRTLHPKHYSAAHAAESLGAVLHDRTVASAAEAIGARVRAENGPAAACDAIEDVLGG